MDSTGYNNGNLYPKINGCEDPAAYLDVPNKDIDSQLVGFA